MHSIIENRKSAMKILTPVVIKEKNIVKLQSTIEYGEHRSFLWYSVDAEYEKWLTTEKLDAFLVALLPLAMKNNEDIYLEWPISERLYYNLTNYYMKILAVIDPLLKPIRIIPKGLDSCNSTCLQGAIATGCSGGIDSFCALKDHYFDDVPDGYRLTHFVFNNMGSHGDDEASQRRFHLRYGRVMKLAEELCVDLIRIDSNLHELLQENYQTVHTLINVSAILTLQKLVGKYLYASTYRYEDCFVGKTYDMAYTDPFAIHLLSTETLDCIATGSQYSRTEKTARITDLEPTYRYLDVCVSTPSTVINCSTCFKCLRTLLTLDILGKLELYKEVFDIDKYYEVKSSYILKILSDDCPFSQEIIRLAKEQDFPFPITLRTMAYFKTIKMGFVLRKVKRKFLSYIKTAH